MDYEKKYKEVLEKARVYWETDNDNTLDIKAKGTMECLFPELAESEDEKIRKELYFFELGLKAQKGESMTQEEKDLLLKDLCGRLPYGVKIQHPNYDEPQELDTIFNYNAYVDGIIQCACDDIDEIVEDKNSLTACRPYLRPMSSMTEEECRELGDLPATIENVGETLPNIPYYIEVARPEQIDWLNKRMFDYRGLIPMGLAIEAPEGMYKKGE